MDTKYLLHTNRDQIRKAVFEKIEKSEDEVQSDIRILKSWFGYQKHLPEVPCDNILEIFLIVNKFNLEKCKKKLESYFTIRQQIPEFYINKHPKLEHMKTIANTVYCLPLPKLTSTLSRITLMKLRDPDPEKFNALDYFAHTYNVIEIRVREDMVLSDSLVYDMQGIKLGHLFKLGPGILRKSAAVFEKVFSSRVEGIHFINLPSSMQILVSLAKTTLKTKIRDRVHVHEDLESLYKYLPRDVLPTDYGGESTSLAELHDLWTEKFKENQEMFDHLENLTMRKDSHSNPKPAVDGLSEAIGANDFRNLCLD